MTRSKPFFALGAVSVVDVAGKDATAIVHNLTTNEVKSLEEGGGCETFVTDVRGKTLGHVHLFRLPDNLRMIGAGGQSERIATHVDRYTIREDATANIRDQEFVALVLEPSSLEGLPIQRADETPIAMSRCSIGGLEMDAYQTRWLGEGTVVLLTPKAESEALCQSLQQSGLRGAGDSAFHHARVLAGFPWSGIDLDESNLPQEADRDALAISFTKGCYLGQETVARLDALGQVQRKLVRWSIDGGIPDPGTELLSGEKKVGRLTSVAGETDRGVIALGFARRSHFEPGSTASVTVAGEKLIGTVQ